MNTHPSEKREDAISFLMSRNTGVLSTLSPEGTPRSRMVYYACDDAFKIYFMTLANTRKVADLRHDSRAAFVVSGEELPRTLQLEGTVEDITDSVGVNLALDDLIHTLTANTKYGAPLARFDAATIKLYCITPTWVRWGNFTFGHGTSEVLAEIDPTEEAL